MTQLELLEGDHPDALPGEPVRRRRPEGTQPDDTDLERTLSQLPRPSAGGTSG